MTKYINDQVNSVRGIQTRQVFILQHNILK